MYTKVRIHQIVYINFVQFLKYQLHLHRAGNIWKPAFKHLNEIWGLPKKHSGEPALSLMVLLKLQRLLNSPGKMPAEFATHSFECLLEKSLTFTWWILSFGNNKIVFGDKFYGQVKWTKLITMPSLWSAKLVSRSSTI